MPGDVPSMPGGDEEEDDGEEGEHGGGSGPHYVLHGHPAWDLFNQSWCAQLVPATHAILPDILREPVPTDISGTVGSPARSISIRPTCDGSAALEELHVRRHETEAGMHRRSGSDRCPSCRRGISSLEMVLCLPLLRCS